jgi:transposase-like protein
LSEHRDIAAAKRSFTQAVKQHGPPEKITVDGYPATHTAVAELKKEGMLSLEPKVRTIKYLNNIIEQDYRRVKRAYLSNAWLQELRPCGSDDQRDRARAEDQEGTVQYCRIDK